MTTGRHSNRTSRIVMWAGIVAAAVLFAGLLLRGWSRGDAWGAAAGMLLLACIASCGWAVIVGRRSERDVRAAIARLAATRRSMGNGRR